MKLTRACSLSAKEKVVPIGGFRVREKLAGRWPSAQRRWDSMAFATIGPTAAATTVSLVCPLLVACAVSPP
jgi:hypothetical protein